MKENQRVAVTKRMLKEGLLCLLRDREMKNIRITELCVESGVNRATFYRHYETVEDVLYELERDIARQMMEEEDGDKLRSLLEQASGMMVQRSSPRIPPSKSRRSPSA